MPKYVRSSFEHRAGAHINLSYDAEIREELFRAQRWSAHLLFSITARGRGGGRRRGRGGMFTGHAEIPYTDVVVWE